MIENENTLELRGESQNEGFFFFLSPWSGESSKPMADPFAR
jgi:hypothetical protein